MAGNYSIDSQVSGYGSVGASAMLGMKQELLRRQAVADAERIRQEEAVRQAAKDEIAKRVAEQSILASQANVAQNEEYRKTMADQREAATLKLAQETFLKTHKPGATTAAERDAAAKIGLGHLFLSKQTPEVAAVPEGSQYEGQPEIPAVPASEDIQFAGTPEQQDELRKRQFAEDALAGKHGPISDAMKSEFTWMLGGGKGTIPAGAVVPPKTAQETKAARELAMIDLKAKIENGYTPTAEETAAMKAWSAYNPTQADIEAGRTRAADAANVRNEDRQARTQTFQTKQSFRREIATEEAKLSTDLERVDRARTVLNSPNFLTDAVAAPEFLQIMAGGMGSGLRMTDAELRRVNEAQSKFNQARAYIAKWGIGKSVTIQEDMRKNMKEMLDIVEAARERKAQLMQDTLESLDSAKDEGDIDKLHSLYWGKKRDVGRTAPKPGASMPAPIKPASSHSPRIDF